MANQLTINIGTTANDGTGDPLRTAFNEVNLNFSNVWATGLPNSNVQFSNNRILTTVTNANLILAPNGTGKVASNVDIVPNTNNAFNLGGLTRRWSTVYSQYIDTNSLTIAGDLSVGGNLTVTGNIIEMGNIVTDALTLQLANTANTANAANGAGITVGANDAIATFLFDSGNNTWDTNIGVAVNGPITGTSLAVSDATIYGSINSVDGNFTGTITTGNIIPLSNVTYSLGNSTNWWSNIWVAGNTIYIGGVPLGITVGNVLTVGGNAVLQNDSNTSISTTGNITADYFFGDGSQLTNVATTGQWAFSGDTAYNSTSNGLYIQASQGNNDGGAYFPYTDEGSTTRLYNLSGAGIELSAGANTWILNPDASIQFPQINTPRGDNPSGSVYGYTLVIGDGENEAVITTPNGDPAGGQSSQRLVINPGKGADLTSGEGGDIYLWAGRGGSGDAANAISGGSGGDIKIRGGQGGGGASATGDGGYIRMEGGDSSALGGSAGFIEITGGVSQDLTGGYVNIRGGQGVTGGDANITGGTGTAGAGGAVRLTGGTSANGLPEYGNIYVQSGVNTWQFDNTGNLNLPQGGIISEQANPDGFPGHAIVFTPTTVIDPTQQLWVYPTGGTDYNHLHLTSGNLYNTELFLGNDSLYVKLANTGNVVINSNDDFGNTAQWSFGADGNLTLPNNTFAVNYANGTAVSLGGNYGDSNVVSLLNAFGSNTVFTTGNITAGNFVGSGSNVEIVAGSYGWTFDNTGNLQGNISLTGPSITINNAPGGNEGAEVLWALPAAANTSLDTSVVQDIYQNGMRFFESGGAGRGFYMDMANAPAGAGTAVGYREIPQITLSGNVTANATNAGRHFYSTTAGNLQITLPDNANVAFPTGATLTVVVNAAGNVLVIQGAGVTLYQAGSATTGNRVVGAYGMATVMKVATDTWVINGTGVY